MFIVVVIAFGSLVLLSKLPWGSMTDNVIKDFDLFEDLTAKESIAEVLSDVLADPAMEILEENNEATSEIIPTEAVTDTFVAPPPQEPRVIHEVAPVEDGIVLIESYGYETLPHLRKALSNGKARIAVLGDSFIEGDILTQDIRTLLQQTYGGSGVGYMNMHSEFPGFRRTVRQSDKGWKSKDIRNMTSRDSIRLISNEYAIAQAGARSQYKGTSSLPGNQNWDRSTFVFLAPDSGSITMTTAAGPQTFDVASSALPQAITIEGETDILTIETNIVGLIGLGAYLDSSSGVLVDCMSVRGNSGLSLKKLNVPFTTKIREDIDYDLIILEYGTNVLSASQKDYTPFSNNLSQVIERVHQCYPNSDILLLGIADRGTKQGGAVISMPTCQAMVIAQREAARRTGIHFWDTRAAMGGDGAVVGWNKRRLVNSDYVHINHAGGKELAEIFVESLETSLDR